jgi:hypothetical protein
MKDIAYVRLYISFRQLGNSWRLGRCMTYSVVRGQLFYTSKHRILTSRDDILVYRKNDFEEWPSKKETCTRTKPPPHKTWYVITKNYIYTRLFFCIFVIFNNRILQVIFSVIKK